MSSRCLSRSQKFRVSLKSITWYLGALLLMQEAEIVQAVGRSPGLRVQPWPQHTQNTRPLKASERDGQSSEGMTRLRVSSHNGNNQEREQRQSQIWTVLMSVVLVFWILRAVTNGLKSLFTDPGTKSSVEVLAEPLPKPVRPSPHSEQMQCLISELESSVHNSGARLPQSLQKEKKAVIDETSLQSTARVEQARELKAFSPYLEVVGES
mmetsp:Transcript_7504/g.13935  ORF Transcript_7504/g.13935 Transcript_7504/m.13935 type:complete len:209 (-) Transcript_7504:122-748(-)